MRRRAGRRKQAAKIAGNDARQQAWAERDAQLLAARTRERLDATRSRGRGRP
jgi:hypothetical protein